MIGKLNEGACNRLERPAELPMILCTTDGRPDGGALRHLCMMYRICTASMVISWRERDCVYVCVCGGMREKQLRIQNKGLLNSIGSYINFNIMETKTVLDPVTYRTI